MTDGITISSKIKKRWELSKKIDPLNKELDNGSLSLFQLKKLKQLFESYRATFSPRGHPYSTQRIEKIDRILAWFERLELLRNKPAKDLTQNEISELIDLLAKSCDEFDGKWVEVAEPL